MIEPTQRENIEAGARVAYEDQANPHREGSVVEVIDRPYTDSRGQSRRSREFRIDFDGEIATSDLRQYGWSLVGVATNDDLKKVETDSEDFADLVDTEWAKLMGGELLITADAGDQQNRDLRQLVERMGGASIENILMVGDGIDQQDAKGQPLPGNVVVEQEVARRVATALAVLFYGN